MSHTTRKCSDQCEYYYKAGRQAGRSYQNASNDGKAIYGTAEQDTASHGWTGHVKTQSKLAILMLAIITGIAYNIIAYSCIVNNIVGAVLPSCYYLMLS